MIESAGSLIETRILFKSVYPLNEKTNINQQIQSVYNHNQNMMKRNNHEIAPVFKPTQTFIDMNQNPIKKVADLTHKFEKSSSKIPPIMVQRPKHRPEFMDLLSMSRKIDNVVKLDKRN